MNVLVIEDDPAVVRALTRALERASYSVTSVDNGLAAIAELGQKSFDAVICDFRLPFLDGEKFYGEIREDYSHIADRIIWVTGFASDEKTRKFLDSTGRPVLGKPYELTDLLSLVRDTVRRDDPA